MHYTTTAKTNTQECFHSTSVADYRIKKIEYIPCRTPTNSLLHSNRRLSSNDHTLSQEQQGAQTRHQPTAHNSIGNSSNKKVKRESKKEVRISTKIGVGFTISRHDMSPNEKSCVWYSEQEYDKINRSCLKQIQKLDQGEILKDKKYCARGLENKTYIASIAQQMHRSLAYNAVFEEQDRQRREGIREPQCIASLYHSVSSSSQLWANAVALTDQRLANANESNSRCTEKDDNKSHSCTDNIRGRSSSCNSFLIVKPSTSSAPFSSRIPHGIELAMAA